MRSFEKPRVFIQDRVKKLICERRVYFFNTVFYHLLRGFDFLFVLALVDLGLYSVFGSVPGIPLFDESAGFSIYLEVAGFFLQGTPGLQRLSDKCLLKYG